MTIYSRFETAKHSERRSLATLQIAEAPVDDNDEALFVSKKRKNTMHGPRGVYNKNSPCMGKVAFGHDVCSKKFPRTYKPLTVPTDDEYPP
ncbi:hypothetical protein FB192DRAFT_1451045 [Mucor lusitanicus]|uniref:Uncharacterized protein n=2 Tax=Mucor circinelloides f. lusitanicus TaxID=29924 RepID=A0A168P039_MUCCL|nr:hypothetical protein FB192DRAFT_1451045 [Mucor lusitanicus]OAD06968.1 hypothetical protein MUCCIDRAFT_107563 [Mucor lusitanicus CBS 277.49]